MTTKLYFSFYVFLFACVSVQAQWNTLGNEGFSNAAISWIEVGADKIGVPYAAYTDTLTVGLKQAVLKKYNGSEWDSVGPTPDGALVFDYLRPAFDNQNTPYLAYVLHGQAEGVVKKFDGTNWVKVRDLEYPVYYVRGFSFDANNKPYILYQGFQSLWVTTLNDTTWKIVGDTSVSQTGYLFSSMVLDVTGAPIVAYQEYGNWKGSVLRFNGSSWQPLGTKGFTSGRMIFSDLSVDAQGNIYLAYTDMDNAYFVTVMKYDGTSWSMVGSPMARSQEGYAPSIVAVQPNEIYVGYTNSSLGSRATVMKFNGSTWNNISLGSFPSKPALCISLARDPFGNLLIGYFDKSHDLKLTVKKFGTATAIPELDDSYILVHPNPTIDAIHFYDDMDASLIRIYNSTGRLEYEGQFEQRLNVAHFSAGLYIVHFVNADGLANGYSRFIKQ